MKNNKKMQKAAKQAAKNVPQQPKAPPVQTKGMWKTGAPKLNANKKKKMVAKKVIPKIVPKAGKPQEKWPGLKPAGEAKKAPIKYVDSDSEPSLSPKNDKRKLKQKQKIVKKVAKTQNTKKMANGHSNNVSNGAKSKKTK